MNLSLFLTKINLFETFLNLISNSKKEKKVHQTIKPGKKVFFLSTSPPHYKKSFLWSLIFQTANEYLHSILNIPIIIVTKEKKGREMRHKENSRKSGEHCKAKEKKIPDQEEKKDKKLCLCNCRN